MPNETVTHADVAKLVEPLWSLLGHAKWVAAEFDIHFASVGEVEASIKALSVALTTERAAHAETRWERDDLLAYAHVATIVITDIAGGGSELFGRQIGDLWTADLDYCNKVIRERRPHKAEVWKERRLKEAAEAQRDEALKALENAEDIFKAISNHIDEVSLPLAKGACLQGAFKARRALEGKE